MDLVKIVKESIEETIFEFKRDYLHWVLIGLFLLALAWGSSEACKFLANGQCKISIPVS